MGKVGISFAIGGSIAAVIMVIGMITLVGGTATPTASTMDILGSYTIKVTDADGHVKAYIQTPNAPTHLLKDCLFDSYLLVGNTVAKASCTLGVPFLRVGDGLNLAATADTSAGLVRPYTNSGDGNAAISGAPNLPTSSFDSETTASYDNKANVIIISQTDLDAAGALGGVGAPNSVLDGVCEDEDADGFDECEIDEVGFFTQTGGLLSHATVAKTLVGAGDQVDIVLTFTQSGG